MEENKEGPEDIDDFARSVLASSLLHEIAYAEFVARRVGSDCIIFTFATSSDLVRADHSRDAILVNDSEKRSFNLDHDTRGRGAER